MTTRGRTASAAMAIGLSVLAAVVALARSAPLFATKADIAVTELYVQLALKGQLVVGPYSRFVWHHPGPLYFWILMPFYALSGEQGVGVYAGALAINALTAIVIAWVLARAGRGALAPLVLGALVAFAWRNRWLLASPWTAHVPVMAGVAVIVLASAVAIGRVGMLPLLIAFGGFAVQTHIALAPMVAAVSAGALAASFALFSILWSAPQP